jgi:hypothetical protein
MVFVEDGSHLLEAVHLQPVGLIDQDERREVRNRLLSRLIKFEGLKVCWVDRRRITWRASGFVQNISPLRFVSKADGVEHLSGFASDSAQPDAINRSRAERMSKSTLEGVLITEAV